MKILKSGEFIFRISGIILSVCVVLSACMNKNSTTEDKDVREPSSYGSEPVSEAEKFSYDDLIVGKLRMGMTEKQIKDILGEPMDYYDSQILSSVRTQEIQQGSKDSLDKDRTLPDERVYTYGELSLIFMPIEGDYKLCAAASLGEKDIFARGIKVGDSRDRILDLFYTDPSFMNHNLMTEDNSTVIGKYLYGSYTMDNFDKERPKDKVEYGVINYDGYQSMEEARSYTIEFTYFKPPYKGEYATYNDEHAQMAFDIDVNGIITAIRWYYYPRGVQSNLDK